MKKRMITYDELLTLKVMKKVVDQSKKYYNDKGKVILLNDYRTKKKAA